MRLLVWVRWAMDLRSCLLLLAYIIHTDLPHLDASITNFPDHRLLSGASSILDRERFKVLEHHL